jgi:cysteine desulfuration protein SufE
MKQDEIKKLFEDCATPEAKYIKIIELGRTLPPFDPQFKTPDNLVQGCQSLMYLRSFIKDNRIYFEVDSDALISKGLAALLIYAYSDQPVDTVLKCPPDFLQELGIPAILSPGRSNGLFSLYLRMKQESVKSFLS